MLALEVVEGVGPGRPKRRSRHDPKHVGSWVEKHWVQKTDRLGSPDINVDNRVKWHIVFIEIMLHAPAFVVLGTWALVLMFRDYSRELGACWAIWTAPAQCYMLI